MRSSKGGFHISSWINIERKGTYFFDLHSFLKCYPTLCLGWFTLSVVNVLTFNDKGEADVSLNNSQVHSCPSSTGVWPKQSLFNLDISKQEPLRMFEHPQLFFPYLQPMRNTIRNVIC